jgi:basic membrane protein A
LSCTCGERGLGVFNVAVVTDAGGLGDKGKNDMVWRGCQRFVEDGGVGAEVESYEPATEAQGREFLKKASEAGAEAVIVASPVWEGYVHALARNHPKTAYLLIGGTRGSERVKALTFPAREAGYMMGVAAAASVPAGNYAFLGGRGDAETRALAAGFGEGVHSENPSSRVAEVYLGEEFEAPLDTAAATARAATLFEEGAAVIFAATGPANAAVAAVARDHDKLIIGYESNQNYLERGYVITSLNIRWDDVLFEELCLVAAGKFAGGARELDLASDHISYPIDDNNRSLIPAAAVEKIEAARQRLAAGGVEG